MKRFFHQEEREKEKHKILELNDEINWKDIENTLEEVDINGEEKPDVEEEKEETKESQENKININQNQKKKKKKKK